MTENKNFLSEEHVCISGVREKGKTTNEKKKWIKCFKSLVQPIV